MTAKRKMRKAKTEPVKVAQDNQNPRARHGSHIVVETDRERHDREIREQCALILTHRILQLPIPPPLRMDDRLQMTNKHRMAAVKVAMAEDGETLEFDTVLRYAKAELLVQ